MKGSLPKPVPADFTKVAPGQTRDQLCRIYGVSTATIRRWREETGVEPAPRSGGTKGGRLGDIIPPDFADLARQHRTEWLAERFKRDKTQIRRWRIKLGIPGPERVKRGVPADFAKLAPTMYRRDLAKHYKATTATIRRWIEQTGAQSKDPNDALATRKPRRDTSSIRRAPRPVPAPKPAPTHNFRLPKGAATPVPPRDATIEGEAADFMRARGWITYRCNAEGQQKVEGSHWRLGTLIVEPDELLKRAEAKGWRAERWAA